MLLIEVVTSDKKKQKKKKKKKKKKKNRKNLYKIQPQSREITSQIFVILQFDTICS